MRKELLGIILCGISGAANATSAFETYGDIGQFAIPAVAAGISWYQGDYDGLEQFGYSLLATTATVEILKNTVDATRPNGGSKSFPSGHTAWAFSGASYLQMRYGWGYGLPAYVAAGAVGWSRVESDNHYWRDVIASAAIATGFSYLFTTPKGPQLAFYPLLMEGDAREIGVSLTY
ncbi:phosphatase PAP2 family protein [Aeromonas aquatica]|uniref:phosphatase PAP2 family protein n=1 Tax=Aeromonas aquatica TaxID=558964 RepID=UPI00286F2BF9|nr:phosphatase PAP2 family protein [Aeromonas aquatica]